MDVLPPIQLVEAVDRLRVEAPVEEIEVRLDNVQFLVARRFCALAGQLP